MQRQALMGKVETLLPKFNSFSKSKKLEVLLFGIFPENRDYYFINTSIQVAVQHFLLDTKRFENQ